MNNAGLFVIGCMLVLALLAAHLVAGAVLLETRPKKSPARPGF